MNQTNVVVDDNAADEESTNQTTEISDDDTAADKDGIFVGKKDFGESGVADVNISGAVSPPLEISNSQWKETSDEVSNWSIGLAVGLVMAVVIIILAVYYFRTTIWHKLSSRLQYM